MLYQRVKTCLNGWGKFYPKKVIQIGGVELSTQISHVQFFIQKSYQNKIIQNYETYSALLYRQQTITQQLKIMRHNPLLTNFLTKNS